MYTLSRFGRPLPLPDYPYENLRPLMRLLSIHSNRLRPTLNPRIQIDLIRKWICLTSRYRWDVIFMLIYYPHNLQCRSLQRHTHGLCDLGSLTLRLRRCKCDFQPPFLPTYFLFLLRASGEPTQTPGLPSPLLKELHSYLSAHATIWGGSRR